MSQTEQTTQITSKKTVLSFLSALKSGTKPSNADDRLFDSLLSQASTSSTKVSKPEITVEIERPSARQTQDSVNRTAKQSDYDTEEASASTSQKAKTADSLEQDHKKTKEAEAVKTDSTEGVDEVKASDSETAEVTETVEETADTNEVALAAIEVAENGETEGIKGKNEDLLAFLASLNPFTENRTASTEQGTEVTEENEDEAIVDVAAYIESELKSLLGTKTNGEDVKPVTEAVALRDAASVKETIEEALALKAQQRAAKTQESGDLTGDAVATANMTDESDQSFSAELKLVKDGDRYSYKLTDVVRDSAGEAATTETAIQPKTTHENVVAGLAGDNLKKAVDSLGGSSAVAKTSGTGELSQNNGVNGTLQSADRYNFSSQLSAARVTNGGNAGLPTPTEQVAVTISKMAKAGTDEMTINLKPAELGKVQVKLEFMNDNKVHAVVSADSQSSLDLLKQDQDSLQRALESAGFQLDSGSMEFTLNENNREQSFQQNFANNNNKETLFATETGATETESNSDIYYVTPGRVNIRV